VRLTVGVFVRGKVVKDGKPVPGITLQLSSIRDGRRRGEPSAPGPIRWDTMQTKIDTDKEGCFLFSNVPPDRDYLVFGVMDSCRKHGVVPVRKVATGASGTGADLGELAMRPGLRLSGRLLLQDGKPPPAGARVVLGLRFAEIAMGDGQLAITGADGKFTFTGLPDGIFTLSVRAPGYHLSPKNRSYAAVAELTGKVEHDIDGLRLLLEPGPAPRPLDFNKLSREEQRKRLKEYQQKRAAPLQGAPSE
jgi:hypothetical protein